jgi:hypothetical protein
MWWQREENPCPCQEFLEGNTEGTKYIFMSHHQNAGQNHDIKK